MLKIFTDGSCDNKANKALYQDSKKQTAGWGVCVIDESVDTLECFYGHNISDRETNNTAELSGLIFGVLLAKRMNNNTIVSSDSTYALNAYRDAEQYMTKPKAPANVNYIRLMEKIKKTPVNVQTEWVKAHDVSLGNVIADYLAGIGRKDLTADIETLTAHTNKNLRSIDELSKYDVKFFKLKHSYVERQFNRQS